MSDVSDLTKLTADTVPEADVQDDAPTETPRFSCEVCGKELYYSGKGRHPKRCEEHKARKTASSIGTRTSAKGDVASAMAAMDMMYDLLGMGLLMTGAHDALDLFQESRNGADGRPGLSERNRQYLENDPQLAKSLAKLGRTGGRYAFATAQVATIGPVLILAAGEVTQKRRAAAAQRDAETGAQEGAPTYVPGGVFVDD